MSIKLFTDDHVWSGTWVELSIELGAHSDEKLETALRTLWSHETLQGCWVNNKKEPVMSERQDASLSLLLSNDIYGIATLPDGKSVACSSFAIRESEQGQDGTESLGIDWLNFVIPTGALGKIYSEDDKAIKQWLKPLYEWLAELGQHVFSRVQYRLALVGSEVYGLACSHDLSAESLPAARDMGYLLPQNNRLNWYPPTVFELV